MYNSFELNSKLEEVILNIFNQKINNVKLTKDDPGWVNEAVKMVNLAQCIEEFKKLLKE
jgi:hypothetical protein